jgi:hypothetical protein
MCALAVPGEAASLALAFRHALDTRPLRRHRFGGGVGIVVERIDSLVPLAEQKHRVRSGGLASDARNLCVLRDPAAGPLRDLRAKRPGAGPSKLPPRKRSGKRVHASLGTFSSRRTVSLYFSQDGVLGSTQRPRLPHQPPATETFLSGGGGRAPDWTQKTSGTPRLFQVGTGVANVGGSAGVPSSCSSV